ncbi:MAG: hypothetical protein P8Y44_04910, partial [Acidobacteriota bacterium]
MSVTDVSINQPTQGGSEIEKRLESLEKRLDRVEQVLPEDKVAIVVFSGDLDRVLASFVIATGAAA